MQFRIPNGTNIEFPNGWVGIVVDQSGHSVQITYGDTEYKGIVTVSRSRIVGHKVT